MSIGTPIGALISELVRLDIVLREQDGRLFCDADDGVLTHALTQRIRAHRRELVGYLRAIAVGRAMVSRREAVESGDVLPLSHAQQRLWFIDQLDGGGAAYHICGAVRLLGELDVTALRGTLDALVERHESLRTTFVRDGAEVFQHIGRQGSFALRELDLGALDDQGREEQVRRQALEEARAGFDLSVGPLIRGRLLRLSAQEHVLLVTMHHIVTDGWSLGVFVREVAALYEAYHKGLPSPLEPLPIQYADYGVWQRRWLQGAVLQEQLQYWKDHLDGAPGLLELPTDRVRPAVRNHRGERVEVVLDESLSAGLRQLSKRHDATLFMALYAGFAILLSRLSGQQDIVIGIPVANRQRREVEGLIGFFVNTLALRLRVQGDERVGEMLRRVRAMTLGGYAHQEVPFEQVVEALQPERSLSHSPLFQVALTLQNAPMGEFRLPGLTLQAQELPSDGAQFDLLLVMQEVEGRIVGGMSYASDLFDRCTVERWGEHLRRVLMEKKKTLCTMSPRPD